MSNNIECALCGREIDLANGKDHMPECVVTPATGDVASDARAKAWRMGVEAAHTIQRIKESASR